MWILAIETTSNHGSVAVLDGEHTRAQRRLESRQYGSELFQATGELLDGLGLRLRDLGLFAVADGPGSFTGVRIGLTAVKGWIEVLGVPAAPISTLRAVAESADSKGAPMNDAPMVVGLDASRDEVYFGFYPEGPRRPVGEEGLESAEDFGRRLATPAFSPHSTLRERFPALRASPLCLAEAVGRLGWLAYQRGATQDALQLDARYIRRSDAELYARPPA